MVSPFCYSVKCALIDIDVTVPIVEEIEGPITDQLHSGQLN